VSRLRATVGLRLRYRRVLARHAKERWRPTVKIALTGATGYTGGHLLRALKARGEDVAILARRSSLSPDLAACAGRVVIGDLRDERAIDELVRGADAVMHVAAVYRTARHPDAYYHDINVGGTRRLLEAALRHGVRRFVHTSTVGVHGDVQGTLADESVPFAPCDIYQETKAEAERLAFEYHRTRGLPVTAVRPAAIYGPGEKRLLKLFRAIAHRYYAIVGTGRPFYHLVYIDDLVDGFLLALDRPEAVGEAFIMAGPTAVTQRELAATIARHTNGRVFPLRIPAWPIQTVGSLCEWICVRVGVEPPIYRRRVDFWVKNRAFSIEKARRLLGYDPKVDVDAGIARTAAWYRKEGWL
jgi:nucleoside-diphosphate-sugar epimerase